MGKVRTLVINGQRVKPVTPPAGFLQGASKYASPMKEFTPHDDALPGGFWIRVLAFILDGLLLKGALIVLSSSSRTPLVFVNLLAPLAYFALFHSSEWQATPGKKFFRLKVVNALGDRVGFALACTRFFFTIISALMLGVGFVVAAFDPQKRTLHDRWTGTFVVAERESPLVRIAAVLAIVLVMGNSSLDMRSLFLSRAPAASKGVVLSTNMGATDDPCANKTYCVVVYLSPRFKHCQSVVPFAQQIRKRLQSAEEVGMKIVVGDDTPEHIQEMAEKIQGDVFLDTDGIFYKAYQIDSLPRWIVLDEKRKVLNEIKGSIEGTQPPVVVDVFLKNHLRVPY